MKNPRQLLIKNIFSNWAMMFVSMIIAFFMSPFLVHNLGKEQYGIWALVLSIISYSAFWDAGMRQSLARYIPKYYAVKDFLKLNQVLSSTNAVYALTGTLVIIGTLIIAFFFAGIFNVSKELLPVLRITLIIIGLNEALRFFFITRSALGPFHRYDIGNAIDILCAIANALVVVYFINKGYDLITLAIITMATALTKFTIRSVYQKRLVPEAKYRIKYIDKQTIKELFEYGLVSFFIVVAWMVIFSSDNIIIGIFQTTTEVTYYSIALTLITYLRTLMSSIGVPLVPAVSHLEATSSLGEINALHTKLSNYLYYLTATICVGIVLFGSNFIYLWMGPDFQKTVNVLHILIIPAAIYLPQVTSNSILLGIGKHRPLLYILIGEATSKIALSLILIQFWGIYGVALGTAIPQTVVYLFIYPRVYHKITKASLSRFYLNSLKMIITSVLFTCPLGLAIKYYLLFDGWPGFAAAVLAVSIAAGIGFWWKVLASEDKTRIITRVRKFLPVNKEQSNKD